MKTLTALLFSLFFTTVLHADLGKDNPVVSNPAEGVALYKADEVRVYKSQSRIEMLFEGQVVKTYFAHLGKGGLLPKRQEGDMRVPEGQYFLDTKNPDSKYHKSLHVSYPNEEDIKRAAAAGVKPGGDIMVHGYPNNIIARAVARRKTDWTQGCMAVEDNEMDEIYNSLEVPTPITIYP